MKMKDPVVSVVVPTYNSAEYIHETISSIESQCISNIEILVVDDCSTDNTVEIVESFKSDKIKIIVLEKNHGGPSRPRAEGVRRSRGQYIAFCDSDDLLQPDALKDALGVLQMEPAIGMVIADALKFKGDYKFEEETFLSGYLNFNSLEKTKIGNGCFVIDSKSAYHGLFFENYILNPGCVVVREWVIKNVGNFDENLKNADDWDLWLRITEKFPIGFVDKVSLHYRLRGGSISTRGAENSLTRIRVLEKHIKQGQPGSVLKQIEKLVSRNYLSAGYASQVRGNLKLARQYYWASLREFLTVRGVKGLLVSFLPYKVYAYLKRFLSPLPSAERGG